MPPRVRPPKVALAVAALIAAPACGPSFQAIYEGNARFEHCYALEEDPHAPMPKKASCWRDWSERYTYGQTRDRIQYATARYVALQQAPSLPTDEALMMAAPGETPRVSTITAPAPTNAFAPPPKVLDPDESKTTGTTTVGQKPMEAAAIPILTLDGGGASPSLPTVLPSSTCSDACGTAFRACGGSCTEGEASAKECEACETKYTACMRACFK